MENYAILECDRKSLEEGGMGHLAEILEGIHQRLNSLERQSMHLADILQEFRKQEVKERESEKPPTEEQDHQPKNEEENIAETIMKFHRQIHYLDRLRVESERVLKRVKTLDRCLSDKLYEAESKIDGSVGSHMALDFLLAYIGYGKDDQRPAHEQKMMERRVMKWMTDYSKWQGCYGIMN